MGKGVKTGGRVKGTPNKVTVSAKAAIEWAFEQMGGAEGLRVWALDNKADFYKTIWPKILPLTLAGDKDNPLIPDREGATDAELRARAIELVGKLGRIGVDIGDAALTLDKEQFTRVL